MKRIKILSIFGTRPEAIKMAPLIKALEKEKQFISRIAVTGQHREMLDQVLTLFNITPGHDLNIMEKGQDLFSLTGKALAGLQGIFELEKPDLALVHGDTTTTFAASLAAFYKQIPVGHVEAGLRTRLKYAPFPEEMNRRLTGALAELHFAPTETARKNLLAEGVPPERIFVTGNTVIDALLATVRPNYRFSDPLLSKIDFNRNRTLVVTTHRRENLGGPMKNIFLALRRLIEAYPDVVIIFPVHKNPAVRGPVEEILGGLERACLIEPLDYEPFVNLINRSYMVLTDSGGLQEEAPSLGKPVLVLREATERPEAVQAGTVKIVGTDGETVFQATEELLENPDAYSKMANAVNPYGDGKASMKIVRELLKFFNLQSKKL